MPATATVNAAENLPLAHELFCLPRPDEDGPRIESYTASGSLTPDGRERKWLVTRCQECGAASYRPKDD